MIPAQALMTLLGQIPPAESRDQPWMSTGADTVQPGAGQRRDSGLQRGRIPILQPHPQTAQLALEPGRVKVGL